MAQCLDYSAGFPGAFAIASVRDQQGNQVYAGAVRYIGFPDRRKCTTFTELADFNAHGLGMALVFEDTAGDWRGGYDAGVRAGQLARAHANAIGFPHTRPIYLAIDQDVVTVAEFATVIEYLRGANGPLGGPKLTGVYGETDVINKARVAGVATWYWDTTAWSHGVVASGIHLFQRVGTVHVGGVDCDVNDIHLPDWGQHNATNAKVTDMEWNDPIRNPNFDKSVTDPADGRSHENYLAQDWLVQGNLKAGRAEDLARQALDGVNEIKTMLAALTGPGVRLTATGEIVVAATTEGPTP
jgi:hypothetical protein